MPHGEFLRLLQLVDASRLVTGRDTLAIRDEDISSAEALDLQAGAHRQEVQGWSHEGANCPECQEITGGRAALREKMYSQGTDFPMEVWQDLEGRVSEPKPQDSLHSSPASPNEAASGIPNL